MTRCGASFVSVEWIPDAEGEPVFDLTGMLVSTVETAIRPGDISAVKVTFLARLVEVEQAEDGSLAAGSDGR